MASATPLRLDTALPTCSNPSFCSCMSSCRCSSVCSMNRWFSALFSSSSRCFAAVAAREPLAPPSNAPRAAFSTAAFAADDSTNASMSAKRERDNAAKALREATSEAFK
eukprot:Amastigsp_a854077_6.p4 type:complete len:109 gc:universal Amastigsp_a854077_6:597-271(-)